MMRISGSNGLITRVTILLTICAALVACKNLPNQLQQSQPCAAEKPTINIVQVDDYFVISRRDMGSLTGYIAALEEGCTPAK